MNESDYFYTVGDLIRNLQTYFKPEDEVGLQIKIDTGHYITSNLKLVCREPDDDYPILSNEDEYGDCDGVHEEIL